MAESAIAVALLFDDGELGSQLRNALHERGARIVHEGALSTLSRSMLESTGAEVLVVNLDDEAEDELDRLYEVIDGDRPRVVFNDAHASRELDGWDRARWARHLAVKVMARGDYDPPRPQHAPQVTSVPEAPAAVQAAMPELAIADDLDFFEEAPSDLSIDALSDEPEVAGSVEETAESESLAAELEALLAGDDLPVAHEDFGSGLKFGAEDELPALHDGHFGLDQLHTQGPAPLGEALVVEAATFDAAIGDASREEAVRPMPSFQLDHLALAPIDESFMPTGAATPQARDKDASALFDRASSWSLVDADEPPAAAPAPGKASDFGIEKLSAADFLAPEGGNVAESFLQPGMSLELVSIEEAIAPTTYEGGGGHEMMLDSLDSAIGRVLVLGAAADSADAVCTFLSMLPSDLRMTVLHVQHMDGNGVERLVGLLGSRSELPVRIATHGARARLGEVLVVPEGQQARLYRDGRIELQPLEGQDLQSSPIDASFTMAANMFGRHAQAIVFAGHANDAVGGCQAIHDRGGQVWVEATSEGHFADMVNGIEAERLNSYAGTPAELAARLVEQMSMEWTMEGRR